MIPASARAQLATALSGPAGATGGPAARSPRERKGPRGCERASLAGRPRVLRFFYSPRGRRRLLAWCTLPSSLASGTGPPCEMFFPNEGTEGRRRLSGSFAIASPRRGIAGRRRSRHPRGLSGGTTPPPSEQRGSAASAAPLVRTSRPPVCAPALILRPSLPRWGPPLAGARAPRASPRR
jgi:hypothetical protein